MTDFAPLVKVESLTLEDRTGRLVLDDICVAAASGTAIGVIGPSGAGKTTFALSLLGEVRPGLRHSSGTVEIAGSHPLNMGNRECRLFRRSQTAWLGQDPAAALTPTMSVFSLVAETLPRQDRTRQRVCDTLRAVGVPVDPGFLRRRPHEISGGQRRRVALARALVRGPALLILDEPLAGLDVDSRRTVLSELSAVRQQISLTLIMVSHDLDALSELTDQVIVMDSGRIVERGPTTETLALPRSQVANDLVEALRPTALRPTRRGELGQVVLSVDALAVALPGCPPLVENATFTVASGEGVAIVGASGAGKTTLARTLIGLLPPRAGRAVLHHTETGPPRRIGFVPQDPATALNPSRTAGIILEQALRRAPETGRQNVTELLETVGLDPELAQRRPGRLSGGQRQRVAVARALAGSPDLLICDEPTSSLDPVNAAAMLDLLARLRAEGIAVVIISHELHNIGRVATKVLELRDRALYPLNSEQLDTLIHERSCAS